MIIENKNSNDTLTNNDTLVSNDSIISNNNNENIEKENNVDNDDIKKIKNLDNEKENNNIIKSRVIENINSSEDDLKKQNIKYV